MNPIAVEQAKQRYNAAQRAIEAYNKATSQSEGEAAWTDFLVAVSTLYSKLEQGAKGHNRSDPWFGGKKRDRKKDQLLRYLHYARNSNEHGIERVAAVTPPNRGMDGRQLKFNERIPLKAQLEDEKGTNKFTGPILDVVLAGPTLKPIRVYDRRHGDHCDPPKEHMGKPIQFADFIADIGMAALPYLRQMIDEAESFVP